MAGIKFQDLHIDFGPFETCYQQVEEAIDMPRVQDNRKSASKLRFQCLLDPVIVECEYRVLQKSPHVPAALADRSLITTYYLAATAREKLRREAGKHNHQLSRLVGHATLLDTIVPVIEREELAEDLERVGEENRAVFNNVRKSVMAGRHHKDHIDAILDDLSWNGGLDDQFDDEIYDEDDEIADDRSSSSDDSELWDPVNELCAAIENDEDSYEHITKTPANELYSLDGPYPFGRGYGISYVTTADSINAPSLKSKRAEVTISPITASAKR